MLMSFLSHILSAWFAFLLPAYSTFKALSHRPAAEAELERWAMYWTIIGAFVAFEYTAEWLICWLPFYWEIKTVFFLFLALPQTQGSTFIYRSYVEPFFTKNEAELDASITAAQENILAFVKSRIAMLINSLLNTVNQNPSVAGGEQQPLPVPAGFAGLLRIYGSSVLGALQPHPGANVAPEAVFPHSPIGTPSAHSATAPPPSFPEPQLY